MKKIIFMRHGYLDGKYSDYSKLNFNEFEDLLTKKNSPHLDKERTKLALNKKAFLSDVNFIICSSENRGIETAQIVKEITNVDFEESSLLNEISFSKGVIIRNDVIYFNNLRKKILTQFYNSTYSEKFDEVKKRVLDFLEYIEKLKYNNILCITHGWFMRLIYIFSIKNSLDKISLKELLDARVPDFLDIIEIKII